MHPNIQAVLETNGIAYKRHLHANFNFPINNPMDFAHALGYEIQRITKSVFIRSVNKEKYAMAVCSVDKKLNFQLLATNMACKKVEIASKDELQQLVGYAPTGVTPLGLRHIPVFMDNLLINFVTVLTGAGIPGEEIEISPSDLQKLSHATLLDITV